MRDFKDTAKAGGKRMTVFGVIAIILGILAMMMPGLTGVAVIYFLGMIVLVAGIERLIWAFQAGSQGRGLLMFAIGLMTLAGRACPVGPSPDRFRCPDHPAGGLFHPRRYRGDYRRDQGASGWWLGLAAVRGDCVDFARIDDLAPVPAFRPVGYRHPAGHQAALHRADYGHDRFGVSHAG
jgi:hypothetical protein